MNIVYQRLPISDPEQEFDLIIGTNIFIYYGAFEQSLARENIAAMLRPGGYLLTNNLLADKVLSKLSSGTDHHDHCVPAAADQRAGILLQTRAVAFCSGWRQILKQHVKRSGALRSRFRICPR